MLHQLSTVSIPLMYWYVGLSTSRASKCALRLVFNNEHAQAIFLQQEKNLKIGGNTYTVRTFRAGEQSGVEIPSPIKPLHISYSEINYPHELLHYLRQKYPLLQRYQGRIETEFVSLDPEPTLAGRKRKSMRA